MKKVFFIGSIIFLGLLICAPQTISAQNRRTQKALDNEYKKVLKTMKKNKWKVDSDRSDEVVLMKHFDRLKSNPELLVVEGAVSNCKSSNICKQVALNNAQNYYAKLLSGKIEGAFANVVKHNANRSQEEIDKTVGGLVNDIKADISGALSPSYAKYKENGDGSKEYVRYFFADPNKVVESMEKILEQSIKETKLTIEEARSISKFVNDELRKEADEQEQ